MPFLVRSFFLCYISRCPSLSTTDKEEEEKQKHHPKEGTRQHHHPKRREEKASPPKRRNQLHTNEGGGESSTTQKRWYVTEALVNEHGRTMGCPRCSSGIGIHNAECRARIEGILLQQSRMKPAEVDEPQGGHTTTNSVPMELEKPAGPVRHGGSSGLEFSETMPPELERREMLTRDRWKRLMSR